MVKMLDLGRQGDNLATTIKLSVKDWLNKYGEGTFYLFHKRKKDTSAYPVPVEFDGTNVVWDVTQSDTQYVGIGEAQLVMMIDDRIVKSVIYETNVNRSIDSDATSYPPAWKSWVDRVIKAAEIAKNAEKAALTYPYINNANRHWMVWDVVTNSYVDTGISAGGSGGGAVDSVNGQTGVVVLDAEDVGAIPNSEYDFLSPYIIEYDEENLPQINMPEIAAASESGRRIILQDSSNRQYGLTNYSTETQHPPIHPFLRFEVMSDGTTYWYQYDCTPYSLEDGTWTNGHSATDAIFVCTYGVTTYQDAYDAYTNGSALILKKSSSTYGQSMAVLSGAISAGVLTNRYTFYFLMADDYGATLTLASLSNSGWSTKERTLFSINGITPNVPLFWGDPYDSNDPLIEVEIDADDIPIEKYDPASPSIKGAIDDKISISAQVAKTASMTQTVGIDENGKLYTYPGSGSGSGSWETLPDKPFDIIGENLKVVDGALTVDTAQNVEQDNTKPITSAAVYTEVGNIDVLLQTI